MKELDLHGIKHEDVKRETIRFIESNWDSKIDGRIITGYSNTMKNLVIQVLDEYKLEYDNTNYFGFDDGSIRVKFY